jgi:hypothetical protein
MLNLYSPTPYLWWDASVHLFLSIFRIVLADTLEYLILFAIFMRKQSTLVIFIWIRGHWEDHSSGFYGVSLSIRNAAGSYQ